MVEIVVLRPHKHYVWNMVHFVSFLRSAFLFNLLCKYLEFLHHFSQLEFIGFLWCHAYHIFVEIWYVFLHLSRCISLRVDRNKDQLKLHIGTLRNISNCPENGRHIVENIRAMVRTVCQSKINDVVWTWKHITRKRPTLRIYQGPVSPNIGFIFLQLP